MARKQSRKSTSRRKSTRSNTVTVAPKTSSYLELVRKNRAATIATLVAVVLLFLLAFPLRFLIVPALVNGQPIFSWQYVAALHQKAGSQILNQIISERLVEQEIAKQGIQVTQEEIDRQVNQIEEQLGQESGGLDAMLSLQGVSRNEFISQIRLNLALEKLVKSTIQISDEDVQAELTKNREIYQSLSEVDAATTAAENLRSDRMQDEFQTWFEDLRSKAKILNFFTQPPLQLPKI